MKPFILATVFVGLAAPALAQQGAAPPVREIIQLEGDLYRFQDNAHFGLFLATDEGIMVVDPLNRGAAEWLAGELDTRFDVPVRYVLYTHHHADHASGAAVWPDATVVAHEIAKTALTPPADGAPLTGQFAAADANGDGMLQREEAPANMAARFDTVDSSGDGALSAPELFASQFGETSTYGGVRIPDQTYSGAEHEVSLGGQAVRMVNVNALHAPDSSLIVFPEQGVLFVADIVNIKRLPFISPTGFSEEDLDTITEAVLAQDFDIVVPGHGEIGEREDVERHRQYHRDVVAGVRAGIDAGQSLEQIQASLPMEEYSDWSAFERHGQNIEGAHGYLTQN